MAEVEDSILNSIKKVIGFDKDYDAFDTDIIIHTNSLFATLTQLGVGPTDGFEITNGETKWVAFTEDNPKLNFVKTYMIMKIKLIFDPPPTSYALAAYEKMIEEYEWRLNVQADRSTP